MLARTHDALYLKDSRYEGPPKAIHVFAREVAGLTEAVDILDVGCAAGEFALYLRREFPTANITGVDVREDLIAQARERVPSCRFVGGSALDRDCLPRAFADIAYMVGVHSIFDDPLVAFGNMLSWVKLGGIVLVFGLFNRYPIDVFIELRRSGETVRESGWNVISQATVRAWLETNNMVASYSFHEFQMPLDTYRRTDDPLRSWTETIDGKRRIVNGIGLIHDFWALRIIRA